MARLHMDYVKPSNWSVNPNSLDLELRRIIDANGTEDFTEVLADDERWDVFYHLSDLRTSILNWYEFKENSELLEIGGEFGALTGMLCDRCAKVTVVEQNPFRAEAINKRYQARNNLEVYAGEVEDIPLEHQFDYITLIGSLETIGKGSSEKQIYSEYIAKVAKHLKPDGKLLIAVENRYGIRYFCGAVDSHTGRPFDGINHYNRGTTGYTFSRQELTDIIMESGVSKHKFYYPLPDYRLTQLIYTDRYLPEKNLIERHIPYYLNSDTLVAAEQEIYDDLIDNHVFPFFSNSFFVECSWQESYCSVIYAAISTDRGREKSFATTIHADGSVRKTALYQEGFEHLKQSFLNIQDLSEHQIPVVPHNLQGSSIMMPYINSKTLSNYMKELIRTDKLHFEEIIDHLYQYILGSSEAVPAEENALKTEETKALDWGIILQRAYIELIPLNCFYADGELLFYDQEFVKENYPAKYIMFRALHYLYAFAPHADSILPLQQLKDKYKLSEVWDIFLAEERKFLSEVRRFDHLKQFYNWTRIDWNRIFNNSSMLTYKGENLFEYKVPARLKAIQKVQLDLLEQLKLLCDKHQLRYFLIYGTLLGAVRHDGFIPWDDDIDIALPREDYNKLLKLAPSELEQPYFLQTPENDTDCFYGGYSKLRNGNTTGIELANWGKACNHGIWIDIFPLDACYSDEKRERKRLKKICYLQRLLFTKVYGEEKKCKDMDSLQWSLYRLLSLFYQSSHLYNRLDKELQSCEEENSKYLGILTHYTGARSSMRFYREDLNTSVLLNFGNMKLPAPVGYKRCLSISHGKDYMRYPSIEERKPHHQAFYAPNVPYKAYLTRFMDTFKNIDGKTIVVFGAGLMFEDYMKKYGKKFRPDFLVDNDPKKWGLTKQGIVIKSPESLQDMDKDKLHLIICNIYYRSIESQIREMGITNYHIYFQEKTWLTGDPPEV